MTTSPARATAGDTDAAHGRRRRLGMIVVPLAILAVLVAFVIGVRGLVANPVRGVNADGTTTLQGTFEPYQCNATACDGYVQAGARSVFVQFPPGCKPPLRGTELTLTARPAPDLGNGSYRTASCK